MLAYTYHRIAMGVYFSRQNVNPFYFPVSSYFTDKATDSNMFTNTHA